MASDRVLVTGGAGFIGSHLVDKLVERGYAVRVLDSLEPQVHGSKKKIPAYLNPNVEFIYGDIRVKQDVVKAVKDVDVIYHFAAAVGVGQSMYEVEHYVDTNASGTATLLYVLVNKEHKVRKLIVASSMSIYGEGKYLCEKCGEVSPNLRPLSQLKERDWEVKCPSCGKTVKPIPTGENKPLQSNSIYALTKKWQEEMCLLIGRTYGIPTVPLRFFNVYGSRQALSNPYTGVCAIFSSRILNNNPPYIYEDGNQTRDFVYIDDIVNACFLALKLQKANYNVYNVGSGEPTSIKDIAVTLLSLLKSKVKPVISNEFRKGDVRHCYADISRIKNDLEYKPRTLLKRGMKNLIDWLKQEKISQDRFDEAAKELEKRGLILGGTNL